MTQFFSTIHGAIIAGPFFTYCEAQKYGIRFAVKNNMEKYQTGVMEI